MKYSYYKDDNQEILLFSGKTAYIKDLLQNKYYKIQDYSKDSNDFVYIKPDLRDILFALLYCFAFYATIYVCQSFWIIPSTFELGNITHLLASIIFLILSIFLHEIAHACTMFFLVEK